MARSFLRSGIGPRILLLTILLVTAGLMLWSRSRRAERRDRAAAAALEAAANPPHVPTEEELAKRRLKNSLAFEGALNDTVNGDDFVETPGYRKLIELVAGSSPGDVEQRASTYLDHAAALREPDLFRGEYVRIRGLLGGLSALKLESPVHDITYVWRGTIAQPDGTETAVIDLVGDPPPLEPQRTVVEVEGVVYRTVAYESRTGDERVAPYLIVRTVRVLQVRAEDGRAKIMITAAGAGAILLYFLLRRAARKRNTRGIQKPPGFKQLFETSRSAERMRQTTPGPKGS
jgi:hypothetical protein